MVTPLNVLMLIQLWQHRLTHKNENSFIWDVRSRMIIQYKEDSWSFLAEVWCNDAQRGMCLRYSTSFDTRSIEKLIIRNLWCTWNYDSPIVVRLYRWERSLLLVDKDDQYSEALYSATTLLRNRCNKPQSIASLNDSPREIRKFTYDGMSCDPKSAYPKSDN